MCRLQCTCALIPPLAAARADGTDVKAAQDAAEALVLAADAGVQPAAAAAAPAAAKHATVKRKSAQKASCIDSFEQRAAAAESAVQTAKKALTRAEVAEDAAEKRLARCSAQLDRILRRATRHFDGKCPRKQFPGCCFRWLRHTDECSFAAAAEARSVDGAARARRRG